MLRTLTTRQITSHPHHRQQLICNNLFNFAWPNRATFATACLLLVWPYQCAVGKHFTLANRNISASRWPTAAASATSHTIAVLCICVHCCDSLPRCLASSERLLASVVSSCLPRRRRVHCHLSQSSVTYSSSVVQQRCRAGCPRSESPRLFPLIPFHFALAPRLARIRKTTSAYPPGLINNGMIAPPNSPCSQLNWR